MNLIFDQSLVFYLPLHERDGSSFTSEDARGHICTVTGALWRQNGRNFDGVDDYITVPDAPSLNLAGDITIEAWVKPASTQADSEGNIVHKNLNYVFRVTNDRRVRLWFHDSSTGWVNLVTTTTLTTYYISKGQ